MASAAGETNSLGAAIWTAMHTPSTLPSIWTNFQSNVTHSRSNQMPPVPINGGFRRGTMGWEFSLPTLWDQAPGIRSLHPRANNRQFGAWFRLTLGDAPLETTDSGSWPLLRIYCRTCLGVSAVVRVFSFPGTDGATVGSYAVGGSPSWSDYCTESDGRSQRTKFRQRPGKVRR